jgi:hypothetical protein
MPFRGGVAYLFATSALLAQSYQIIPATPITMPARTVDGNSPAFRDA